MVGPKKKALYARQRIKQRIKVSLIIILFNKLKETYITQVPQAYITRSTATGLCSPGILVRPPSKICPPRIPFLSPIRRKEMMNKDARKSNWPSRYRTPCYRIILVRIYIIGTRGNILRQVTLLPPFLGPAFCTL